MRSFAVFSTEAARDLVHADAFSVTPAFRPVAAAHVAPKPFQRLMRGFALKNTPGRKILAVGELEIAAP